ncbi:DUF3772 domain-containing protein [Breoghania sp. L-A4]|uniref:DUF3772 domain-containing protein n=1 Tax=Breoghania sp. L-A4 TaxID=2304600 RepID=UPI0013C33F14|nr:DUF3772 domain-containing protein [Breoghania sp. L-A4]
MKRRIRNFRRAVTGPLAAAVVGIAVLAGITAGTGRDWAGALNALAQPASEQATETQPVPGVVGRILNQALPPQDAPKAANPAGPTSDASSDAAPGTGSNDAASPVTATDAPPVAGPLPTLRDAVRLPGGSDTLGDQERAAQVHAKLDAWTVTFEQIDAALKRPGIGRPILDDLRSRAEAVKAAAEDTARSLQPRVKAVERKVAELAPAEAGAEAETEEVRAQLAEQRALLATLTGALKQVQVVQLRAEEMITRISDVRRGQLTRRLLTPSSSILDPGLWLRVATDTPATVTALRLLVQDWFSLIYSRAGGWAVLFVFGALIASVILVWPVRHVLLERAARDGDVADPTPVARSGAAVAITFLAVVVPVITMVVLYRGLDVFELMPERIGMALRAIFRGLLMFAFAQGLGWAVIAPKKPGWRLIPLSDARADGLMKLVFLGGVVFGLGLFADGIDEVLRVPVESSDAIAAVISIAVALLSMAALRIVAAEPAREEEDAAGASGLNFLWRWLMPVYWLAALVSLAAPVFGYIQFSWFITEQIVWSASVLGLLHLLLIFTDDVAAAAFRADAPVGRGLTESLAISGNAVEQIGVLLSGVVRILLIVGAVVSVLAPWGVNTTDITSLLRQAMFGFQVGSFTFALSDIVIGLAIFVVGLTATRAMQRWLENRYLPHTRLDVGLKTSIRTTFGYIGVIIAAMAAFTFMGLDLQNVAIVAGALSVGIGFGLQSIVNNFVSGLILLAERPIKVGDWIVVGAEQGFVRRINVRATEIETFDRQTVIVPNSDLISGVVKNWMHHDTTGRIIIPIGVSYASDPEQVRDILMEVASDTKQLLAYPAPQVFFMEFGASSLDFELRAYLANIDQSLIVKSEIRFDIIRRFREAGIEIPFPQQDIHLRDMDRLEAVMGRGGRAARPAPAETAAARKPVAATPPGAATKDDVSGDEGSQDAGDGDGR